MKRRRFLQTAAATPAAPALLAQQPGRQQTYTSAEVPKVATVVPDAAAEPVPKFFTAPQFAALRKLSDVLQPPLAGNPGAIKAGAPEFLDFLLSVSPADRQKLYRGGLDLLNSEAKKRFGKSFAEADAGQVDTILKPLLTAWTYDPPEDPGKHFLTAARADIRTATLNSREYASAAASTGGRRRRGGGGVGLYWHPIDPTRSI